MNKNDRVEVLIEGYSSEGYGIAKPQGYVLFIPGTLRGERVLAHVLKAGKNFGYAKAEKILAPSPSRILPECPVCGICGGCGLMHMSYAEELEFKRQKVLSNLKKAGIDIELESVIGSPRITGYRNKAQYPVRNQNGKIAVGFYRRASHDVTEGKCFIQPDIFDTIAQSVREFMEQNGISAYNEHNQSGTVRHIYLRCSQDFGEIMLCLVVNGSFALKNEFARTLTRKFSQISTVCINYNDKNTNVILGESFETVFGAGYITDTLCGRKFEISPQAFYQVNHDMCETLYGIVSDFAMADKSTRVLDLYCGIGTVGICAAADARELVGVEIVPQAVKNARRNAEINGIENASFYVSDAAGIADLALESFDVIIVDPPRKGCDRATLDYIISEKPKRLVYVSCDSATLARDLAILTAGGFSVTRAAAADMFPRTKHVETVVQLVRKKPDTYIDITVDMDELDLTSSEAKATYDEIKDYIFDKHCIKVSSLYVAQVKQKHGIIERDCYNNPKKDNPKQPQCPPEKVKLIEEALR